MSVEQTLVSHLTRTQYRDLPDVAVERARIAILDILGVGLAGTARAEVRPVVDLVLEFGGRPDSVVFGTGTKVPATHAALANGTLARAWDFDDIFKLSPAAGHASVNIVPAALAMAERESSTTGADLLAAIAIAQDLFCRLSLATRTEANETGRYCQFAIFAPTAAAGRLLRMDEARLAHSLGIAYAQVGGEMQKYQTSALTIAVQNGFIPMSGIMSALLAARGITGARDMLTGHHGFFKVFEPDHDLSWLTRDLGVRYMGPDLSIKAYPCCSCSHTAIEAALHLANAHDLRPEDIEAVQIGVNRAAYDSTCVPHDIKWNPTSTSYRQFSVPYAVAAALVEREITINTFLPRPPRDAIIWRLLEHIRVAVDPDIQRDYGHLPEGPGQVTIRTREGREHTHRVEYERGHSKNPMTWTDVTDKFAQCAATAGLTEHTKISAVLHTIERLEEAVNLEPLWSALRNLTVLTGMQQEKQRR
jgi:2-methylcitrate dehydratase PrpD